MAIALAQYTITDINDITTSAAAPANPSTNQLWLDTSATPDVLKKWDGSEWVKTGASSLEELDSEAYQTMTAQGTAISTIQGQISSKVWSTDITTAVNGVNTRISSAESSITQNADNIDLKVSKDNVIAQINLSSESVQIQGDKINILGNAVFQDLTSTLSGQTVIKGSAIKTGTISSANNVSSINLDSGTFSFGNGKLAYDGTLLNVSGEFSGEFQAVNPVDNSTVASSYELGTRHTTGWSEELSSDADIYLSGLHTGAAASDNLFVGRKVVIDCANNAVACGTVIEADGLQISATSSAGVIELRSKGSIVLHTGDFSETGETKVVLNGYGAYICTDGSNNREILTDENFLNKVYPVGSIYMSIRSNSPASLFGGSWTQIKGRFLLGVGLPDNNTVPAFGSNLTYNGSNKYNEAAGNMGGESLHTLSRSELPNETLKVMDGSYGSSNIGTAGYNAPYGSDYPAITTTRATPSESQKLRTDALGSGYGHTNMPPYYAVYIWRRVS